MQALKPQHLVAYKALLDGQCVGAFPICCGTDSTVSDGSKRLAKANDLASIPDSVDLVVDERLRTALNVAGVAIAALGAGRNLAEPRAISRVRALPVKLYLRGLALKTNPTSLSVPRQACSTGTERVISKP